MANFTSTSGTTNVWNKSFSGSDFSATSSKKISIPTKEKYLDRDIEITIPSGQSIVGTAALSDNITSSTSTTSPALIKTAGYIASPSRASALKLNTTETFTINSNNTISFTFSLDSSGNLTIT